MKINDWEHVRVADDAPTLPPYGERVELAIRSRVYKAQQRSVVLIGKRTHTDKDGQHYAFEGDVEDLTNVPERNVEVYAWKHLPTVPA